MEPDFARTLSADRRARADTRAIDPDLLPSRRLARASLRGAMARSRGPVALTGEPGSGKTTLWRSLEAEREPGTTWVVVEMTPGLAPRDLDRLIARGLGVRPDDFGRPELLDWLASRSLDGDRFVLVVEEAQNLDAPMLEGLRVLSNRLGELDGFASMLLVGQTALARWLAGNEGRALASRLAGRVHLKPLDVDEVELLLNAVAPDSEWPEQVVDRVHLESRGRPGLVLDAASHAEPSRGALISLTDAEPEPPAALSAPLMGPARPPIRVEDGLIEVGWAPEPDPASAEAPKPEPTPSAPDRGEERVDDPYAALQAWREWATNQGRHPEIVESPAPSPRSAPARPEPLTNGSGPRVWADEEHDFAPFGRLFGRIPQENETD